MKRGGWICLGVAFCFACLLAAGLLFQDQKQIAQESRAYEKHLAVEAASRRAELDRQLRESPSPRREKRICYFPHWSEAAKEMTHTNLKDDPEPADSK
jgi:hypothetical protein